MKFASRSRRLPGLVLLALCFLLAGPGVAPRALAQAALAPSGAIVRQIEVQYVGRATVTRERILANMRTAVGQPFNQTAVEEDIRNLYGTGEVSNVRIFSEPTAGGVKVIVIVATKSIIKEVVFEGNKHVGSRRLQREVKAKKGGTLDEESIEEDRQKLLDYYHDKGYNDVAIKANVVLDEANNSGTVTFSVNEGDRGNLQSVRFEGNHVIKSRELRGAMKDTKGKTIIAFIDKSGRLDPNKLKDDLNNIRDLYQTKGYIDVEIPETRVQRLSNGDVNLVIVISEGHAVPRRHASSFEGTQIFTDVEIKRFLKMKEGAVYSPKGLKDDREDRRGLLRLARVRGRAKVSPEGHAGRGPNKVNLQATRSTRAASRSSSASTFRGQHPDQGQGHPPRNSAWHPATFSTPCSSRRPRSGWKTSVTLRTRAASIPPRWKRPWPTGKRPRCARPGKAHGQPELRRGFLVHRQPRGPDRTDPGQLRHHQHGATASPAAGNASACCSNTASCARTSSLSLTEPYFLEHAHLGAERRGSFTTTPNVHRATTTTSRTSASMSTCAGG